MSSGDSNSGAERHKYRALTRSPATVSELDNGNIILWLGPFQSHVVKVVSGGGGDPMVAGPTITGTIRARAGQVRKVLGADEILGMDGEGMVHVLDGETAIVYDGDEVIASQSLHGHSTELWVEYVASEHGWGELAGKYRGVLR